MDQAKTDLDVNAEFDIGSLLGPPADAVAEFWREWFVADAAAVDASIARFLAVHDLEARRSVEAGAPYRWVVPS